MIHTREKFDFKTKRKEEGLYLLPLEDGSTAITFLEENQTKLITYPLEADLEEFDGYHLKEKILEYAEFFPEEYRLKVSLFKEMSRSLPFWAEVKDYIWLRDILHLSCNGQLVGPRNALTETEEIILKWLLFTVKDPKVTMIPKTCLKELFQGMASSSPMPSYAFFLEHREFNDGKSKVGFLSPAPEEILPLIYLFPEAAKGHIFFSTPGAALDNLSSRHTFSLAGKTEARYWALVMLEFYLHPGVELIETSGEDEFTTAREEGSIYRIIDTKNIRPFAILLYQAPVILKDYSLAWKSKACVKLNAVIMFSLISLCILGQALNMERFL